MSSPNQMLSSSEPRPADQQSQEQHASDAVGGEQRLAVVPLAEARHYVQYAREQYEHDSHARSDKQDGHDSVPLQHLEAGEKVLVAEHAAVDEAKYSSRHADTGEYPNIRPKSRQYVSARNNLGSASP